MAIWCELLNPIVARVGDVDIAIGVHGHRGGTMELDWPAPITPPGSQSVAVGRNLDDVVQFGVSQIQIAGPIEGHALWSQVVEGLRE